MKRSCAAICILLFACAAFGDSVQTLVTQANAEYERGDTAQAISLLATALATNPGGESKKLLLDSYVSIGTREYDARNWKNAYACLKAAVKLAPTDPTASRYFWKMKNGMDVANLKNEGAQAADQAKKEAAAKAEAALAASQAAARGGSTGAGVDSSTEALEKLAKTERELDAVRASAAAAARESAAVKAEQERLKQAAARERERQESQSQASAREREAQAKAIQKARAENQALHAELGKQRGMLDQIMDKKAAEDAEAARALSAQVAEQRESTDRQLRALSDRTWRGFAAVGIFILAAIMIVVLVVRSTRRKGALPSMGHAFTPSPPMILSADRAMATRGLLAGDGSGPSELFLEEGVSSNHAKPAGETALYGELVRAERIKRLYDQMRQGVLQWETLRGYIGELEKNLRIEILKVAEMKILEGDGVDPRAVLPILYPFLTDSDDYLRDKAEVLVKDALRAPGAGEHSLTAVIEEDATDSALAILRLDRLTEIPAKLKKILKDRDRSLATARISRGMARILGFSPADADMLYKTALAHDAGYLLLDAGRLGRILGKAEITPVEMKYIQGHTQKGLAYFKDARLPQEFADGILYHHERNDGSGYPKGLSGSDIPPTAKLIGLAETFVAMNCERPYRGKRSPTTALEVIRDGARTRFDRQHVDALGELARCTGGVA